MGRILPNKEYIEMESFYTDLDGIRRYTQLVVPVNTIFIDGVPLEKYWGFQDEM